MENRGEKDIECWCHLTTLNMNHFLAHCWVLVGSSTKSERSCKNHSQFVKAAVYMVWWATKPKFYSPGPILGNVRSWNASLLQCWP